jgi:hypothetical protein
LNEYNRPAQRKPVTILVATQNQVAAALGGDLWQIFVRLNMSFFAVWRRESYGAEAHNCPNGDRQKRSFGISHERLQP